MGNVKPDERGKISQPLRVDATRRKWGKEAFLDAGEATFGEQ